MMATKVVLNALYYSGLQSILNPLLSGSGSILMLHRVCEMPLTEFSPNYHLSISPAFLDVLLKELSPKYDLVSMDEMYERMRDTTPRSSKPFLAITLDDGYIDNLENAVPIFQKYNAPYTIFVAPGMSNAKSPLWWEDLETSIRVLDHCRVQLPLGAREFDLSSHTKKNECYTELMDTVFQEMDEKEARKIVFSMCEKAGYDSKEHLIGSVANMNAIAEANKHPLCTIGAHTMSHFNLAKLKDEELVSEMEESKVALEQLLGSPVEHFAYPYGFAQAAGEREFDMARQLGFKTAVTTRHGVVYPESAQYFHALPRVSVNGRFQKTKYVKTLLSGVPTRLKNRGKKLDIA